MNMLIFSEVLNMLREHTTYSRIIFYLLIICITRGDHGIS